MIFIEIGKNASSALKEAMNRAGVRLYRLNHGSPIVKTEDDIIFCYRDPVSRFISAWRSRYEMGYPEYYPNPWKREEANIFKKYDTPEKYIQSVIKKRENFKIFTGHLIPQSEILKSIRVNQIYHVLDFKNLQNSFDRLMDKLGKDKFELNLKHSSENSKDFERVKCPSDYRELSSTTIEWIKTFYREDYKYEKLL